MNYGSRIATLRNKKGLTQDDLSSLLGISRAALSHYEKNRREPDYDTLIKIADVFKVSIDYLVGRTDNSTMILEQDVRSFVDQLELSDKEILEKFTLTIDGAELTPDEARRFIAFVRTERSMKN